MRRTEKYTLDYTFANDLIALVHDKGLPFEIELGDKVEDGINVAITYEPENRELLNNTMCDIINSTLSC
ncbi:hypothetical protein [uncultured Bacteroides sp.]|uniref:hypothetical protein n=1 Tax=uncultured Bacteroides sp. TaxID=162156 RepID=UPI002AABFA48|nr:hypothetical protein [uncultured Bacteroides sp.]